MSRRPLREALWALAVLLCTLAPSQADGNIGCLFSASLCTEGVEWCYDDFAFGKCIPLYEDEPEDSSLYQYDMSTDELKSFESELQKLVALGYRWEHAYTQCILQAMLYASRQRLDEVNIKICAPFADPSIISEDVKDEDGDETDPEETAYVRFTPNSPVGESDFANEVYAPPPYITDTRSIKYTVPEGFIAGDPVIESIENSRLQTLDDEALKYKLRNIMKTKTGENQKPFGGFRERINSEDRDDYGHDDRDMAYTVGKNKKSFNPDLEKALKNNEYTDTNEDNNRIFAKNKITVNKVYPYSAEFITGNRFSPVEANVLTNTFKKYRESFNSKQFPFEYEEAGTEFLEPRIYMDEDGPESFHIESGSGEYDPYQGPWKDNISPLPNDKNKIDAENILNYWNKASSPKFRQNEEFYAEGGPFKVDGAVNAAKNLHNEKINERGANHNDFNYDPTYTFVQLKGMHNKDWNTGLEFISTLRELLGLEKQAFTFPRVEPDEVTFKVEKNSKNMDAADVARGVDAIKDDLQRRTGAQILAIGVGDKSKLPLVEHITDENLGLELPVILMLAVSFGIVVVGGTTFFVLMRRDDAARRKLQGLASAADIDAEATKDYQELCRARMSGKWSGPQPAAGPGGAVVTGPGTEPPQRITSLSREPDANSPSTRSSTSSWSEEPALTNMDISTGHMVLAYMEDHLKNKDRLEEEWRALCAYEAEPCATAAALRPDNAGKNRYADVLPYDHSRVTLNTLTNHLASDYINASTITDHDPRNPAYIAAAGPLAHTAPDFWQMVWEQGSVVMVMLTRLTENGQQLCHRYWPEEGSDLYHIYEVHLVSEHIWCDDYLVRSFYLKNQRTGETRTVTQFHFLSWPDNGVPVSTKALLEFRRKVNKSYRGRSCPIVVHCSDGASRSGTYCLIDMVLNRMAKGAKEIDIAATLEHIRDQRPRTVATRQQFEFVLMAVAEEVHAILKALPAQLQQMHEKKEKDANDKEKPAI